MDKFYEKTGLDPHPHGAIVFVADINGRYVFEEEGSSFSAKVYDRVIHNLREMTDEERHVFENPTERLYYPEENC